MKKLITIFTLALVLLPLPFFTTGCQTGNITDTINNNEALVKASIQYATLRIIDGDTERAERVLDGVNVARNVLDDAERVTTVKDLTNIVREKLDWSSISPENQILANLLIDKIAERIVIDIERGVIDPESLVVVGNLLDWVGEAASLYASGQSEAVILGLDY